MNAQFDHHPDAEIDACVEVERLQGLLCNARIGLERALDYTAVTENGIAIKNHVRWSLTNSV